MGSFDNPIAMAKLTFIEKYKKAKVSDLNLVKNKLNAEVSFFDDGQRARVTYLGQTTTVDVLHFE